MQSARRFQLVYFYFTLIELLIIIAIIAILAAILLPALNSARERAQSLRCLSTEKQYGNAAILYIGDYSGHLMPNQINGSWINSEVFCWRTALAPYLGIKGMKPSTQMVERKLFCETRNNLDASSPLALTQPNYAVNNGLPGKMEKVKVPSRVCWVTEYSRLDFGYNSATLNFVIPNIPSHKDSANVLFCDGHVATVPYKTIPCPQGSGVVSGTSPGQSRSYRFWSDFRCSDTNFID